MSWNIVAMALGGSVSRRLKGVLTGILVFHLFVLLYVHRPNGFRQWVQTHQAKLSPKISYRLDYLSWLIGYYAYIVGIDNRWQMFSYFHRFDWWFTFKGVYGGEERVLPTPLQGERTALQKHFFDHKTIKFHLNIYGNKGDRLAYSRFLCRKYSEYEGKKMDGVVVELHHREIYSPQVALKAGRHGPPGFETRVYDRFQC